MGDSAHLHPHAGPNFSTHKRILFVLTSNTGVPNSDIVTGFSLLDLARAYRVLSAYRYDIHITSINGGKPEPDPTSSNQNDPDVKWFMENPKLKAMVETTDRLEDHSGQDWDAIYFVGGYGCMWDYGATASSKTKEVLNRIGRDCYDHGGVLAAIGHGVLALLSITGFSPGQISADAYSIVNEMTNISGTANAEEDLYPIMKSHLPYFKKNKDSQGPGHQTVEDILTQEFHAKFSSMVPLANHVAVCGRIITGQNPNSAEGVANRIISLLFE